MGPSARKIVWRQWPFTQTLQNHAHWWAESDPVKPRPAQFNGSHERRITAQHESTAGLAEATASLFKVDRQMLEAVGLLQHLYIEIKAAIVSATW